jgi:hypothetical protein
VFASRAAEAAQLGRNGRPWPPEIAAYPHWARDYERAAASAGLALALGEAVRQANEWIALIDSAR